MFRVVESVWHWSNVIASDVFNTTTKAETDIKITIFSSFIVTYAPTCISQTGPHNNPAIEDTQAIQIGKGRVR